jgi:hypothetical protein
MATSIRIEQETGVAIATCSGALGPDEARQFAAALWKLPGWGGRSALWDFRDAVFDFSSASVRRIAQFVLANQPTPPPARIAFVTQRDVDFGMARMFEVFREDAGTAFRVFRDYDEALDWARSLGPA